MGWGEAHRTGAGTTGQIEDAHKALDCVSIAPGPLAARVLEAVGRIARLSAMSTNDERPSIEGSAGDATQVGRAVPKGVVCATPIVHEAEIAFGEAFTPDWSWPVPEPADGAA